MSTPKEFKEPARTPIDSLNKEELLVAFVAYEAKHGMAATLLRYRPMSTYARNLNENYDSIYGEVDIDWMIHTAASGATWGGVAGALAAYGVGKPFWNVMRGDWNDPFKNMGEEGNRNAPYAAAGWIWGGQTLAEIFAPALAKIGWKPAKLTPG